MLILKHLPVASFSENIAYINRNCSAYKADDINALVKIEIHGGVRTIYAFLQIVDDDNVVAPNQLALNNEAFEQSLGEEVIDKEQDIEPDDDEFDDEGK